MCKKSLLSLTVVLSGSILAATLVAQPAPQGKGFRQGKDAAHRADMELFHFLLDHRNEITRKVTDLPNGVETLTESANPKVTEKLHPGPCAVDVQASRAGSPHPRP